MKSYLSSIRSYINREKSITISFLILSMVLMTGIVSAATTISTDITTGGYLSVTGTATTSSFAGSLSVGTSSNFTNGLFSVGTSSPLFYVDKLSGYLGIGTASPVTQLHVAGQLPAVAVASVATGNAPMGIVIKGRYAYVINQTDSTLQTFDISVPSSPVSVGTVATLDIPAAITVSGSKLFVTEPGETFGGFQIFDISNPASPVSIGSSSNIIGYYPNATAVYGRYAYMFRKFNAFAMVFDVNNPSVPLSLRTIGNVTSRIYGVYIKGKYMYGTDEAGALNIIDLTDPATPVLLSATNIGGLAAGVYVQGKYAYIVNQGSGTLQIYDITNPASPTSVSTLTLLGTPANKAHVGVVVQDRYAYIVNWTSNTLQIVDVSNPASPLYIGSVPTGTNPVSLDVKGHYAYVVNNGSNTLQVFDIGGAYIQQIEAGGIEAGSVSVLNDLNVDNNVNIGGGASISSGLIVNGPVSLRSATSTPLIVSGGSNASTTVEIGNSGQGKGSCLVMYDNTGTVKYVSIVGGSFVISATSCK